jgi:hypothetical protein
MEANEANKVNEANEVNVANTANEGNIKTLRNQLSSVLRAPFVRQNRLEAIAPK